MASKKGGGSSTNGRDSHGQRLGVKRFGGQLINAVCHELVATHGGTDLVCAPL